jgi:hypothetical protein
VFQIRDPVVFLPLGSGKGKKSGSGILDKHIASYFRELRNYFFGLKYLTRICHFGVAEPDPGSGMEKLILDLGWKKTRCEIMWRGSVSLS